MSWVRLDDDFHNHPKVALLGDLQLPAIGLHVLALCWSNSYLQNGVIPAGQVPKLCGDLSMLLPQGTPGPLVCALVDAGLWEVVEGGWQIHDYLDYQPSRYEILKQRRDVSKQRSKAGSKGLASRWQNDSKPDSKEDSKP